MEPKTKDPPEGNLSVVTKRSNGTIHVEDLEIAIAEGSSHDLVVEIVGTTKVTFYYKESTGVAWTSTDVTTVSDLPDGPMLFSAATLHGTLAGNLILRLFEYEAER